jgi:hypothetical protein
MDPHSSTSAEPLGLTVHSLPHPVDAAVKQRTRRGRWSMLVVLLVCAAPVIASYFTYYVVRPSARSSYGELIEAQPGLPAAVLLARDGSQQNFQSLKGQWLLVSVAGGACDARCQHHLYLQRQLRESLGKEKERLDWVWLINDDAPVPAALEPALSSATVLRAPPAVIAAWLRPSKSHALEDHLYLVDPMGHWMLRFPAALDTASAGRAKHDLDRLMRASSSWDEPGR